MLIELLCICVLESKPQHEVAWENLQVVLLLRCFLTVKESVQFHSVCAKIKSHKQNYMHMCVCETHPERRSGKDTES